MRRRPRRLYRSREDVRAWLIATMREHVGYGQAITLAELHGLPDCPPVNGRQLRAAISDLVRRDRVSIIGDSRIGYYLPAAMTEVRGSYRELRHRAIQILVRAQTMLDAGQHTLGGQGELRLEIREANAALAALGAEEDETDE